MLCLYCLEELVFVEGKGWVHKDGNLYKGYCYCSGKKHSSPRDEEGNLVCPHWVNHHAAIPFSVQRG